MLHDSDLIDNIERQPKNAYAAGASEEILNFIKHK